MHLQQHKPIAYQMLQAGHLAVVLTLTPQARAGCRHITQRDTEYLLAFKCNCEPQQHLQKKKKILIHFKSKEQQETCVMSVSQTNVLEEAIKESIPVHKSQLCADEPQRNHNYE